jgi:hypothetical protein
LALGCTASLHSLWNKNGRSSRCCMWGNTMLCF